ncbi:MAG: trehalose synthase [Gemmatimonadetes bacterium]|nr:trehalose synthase [Gemmatimonadota bacterium]
MANENVTVAAAVAALSSDDLLRFLGKQRWFAAKGAAVSGARVRDMVVLPWGDGAFGIARIAVRIADAEEVYQLPVAARKARPDGTPDVAIIDTGDVTLLDAVHDPDFRAGLASAVASGVTVAGPSGVTWVTGPIGAKRVTLGDNPVTKVGAAEQSNTSIVIGDRAIMKLFRVLKPGVHPDVEVAHFLTTRTDFRNTPALIASVAFASDDERMTAGMVQEYLAGSTDAWSYALERGKEYFSAPPNRDAPNTFADDAKRLGAITRTMHEALASDDDDPAFAPEPVSHEDIDRWAHRAQQSIRDSLALLERQVSSPDFPKERVAEAQALVRRGDHYIGWVDEIDDQLGDDLGSSIRVHGDYHLGQVLHTAQGDFMIIDFEGEPSKSLAERREKTSPLRDVAGMLRSFAYAAATLAMSVDKKIDAATRELRSARWERDVRTAFLAGYLGDPAERDDHPDVLPEEEVHVRQLITLFETEKAFYELAYELNNRPAWAWIPMRGISKLSVR